MKGTGSGSLSNSQQTKQGRYGQRLADKPAQAQDKSFLRSDDFFRHVLDSLEDYAVFTTNTEGNINSWNKGAERLLGFAEEEIIGKNADIFFIPGDITKEAHALELKTAAEKGRAVDERYHQRKDGTRFWASGLVFPLRDQQGKPRGFTKVMRDLSGKKALQAEVENERQRLRDLFMQAPAMVALTSGPEHVYEFANPLYLKVVGKTESIIGKSVGDVFPELENQGTLKLLDGVYETGEPYLGNEVLIRLDTNNDGIPEDVYFNFVYLPSRNASGKVDGILVHAIDVTDQVLARRKVEQNEERFRKLIEHGTGALALLDPQGVCRYVSPTVQRILGYTAEELIGTEAFQYILPEEAEYLQSKFQEILRAHGKTVTIEHRYKHKDGSIKWLENTVANLLEEPGIEAIVSNFRDITADKEHEVALSEALEKLQLATEAGKVGTWDWDLTTDTLHRSDQYYKILGLKPGQLDGALDNYLNIIHPDDCDRALNEVQKALKKARGFEIDYRIVRPDGTVRWVTDKGSIYRNETGTPVRASGTCIDVTSRKEAEENMKRDEELLQTRVAQQTVLKDLGLKALSGVKVRELMNEAVKQLKEVLQVEYTKVLELLPGGKEVILRAGMGWHKDIKVDTSTVDTGKNSQAGYTLLSSKPVIVKDLRTEKQFNGPQLLVNHGVVSGMSCIIYGKEEPYGVLGVHTTKRRNFTEDDVGFLQSVANVLAMAIQRKQAEDRVKESEEQFRLLVQGVKDYAIFRLDTEGHIATWNEGAKNINGYESDEVIGKHFSIFYVPEDKANKKPEKELKIASKEGSYQEEGWRLRKDGFAYWASVTISAIRDGSGKLLGFTKVTHDMTESMQHEESLKYQTSLLETMTNNATLGLLMMDDRQHCTFMNPAAERMTGYSVDEVKGAPLHEFVHHTKPDGTPYPISECPIDQALPKNNREQGEEIFVHKDGTFYPVAFTASPIIDHGKPVGTIIEARDLTEVRKTQAALAESEERFRTLAEAIPQLVWVAAPDGAIEYFNRHWYDFTGQTAEQALGWGWIKAVHPKDVAAAKKQWNKAIKNHENLSAEYRIRAKNGDYRWFLGQGSPLRDKKGGIIKWFGASTDIEDLKRRRELEEITIALTEQRQQLMALNKAKDDFISLASHQLRTPATGVKQYVGMLLEGYVGNLSKEQQDMLHYAYASNERQLNIVDDLLKVAHIDAGQVTLFKEKTDIAQLLRDVLREQHSKFKSRSQRVVYDRPDSKVMAMIDRSRLRMVLENLVDNASKYTPEGKKITVKISEQPKTKKVVISVKDEGVGIAEEDFNRLFQKFSRLDNVLSQAVGGSGLGLYWVKKVVDLHEGTIKVKSTVDKGTTFTIQLPTLL